MFSGETLDWSELERATGLKPTRAILRGTVLRSGRVCPEDRWFYESRAAAQPVTDDRPLPECIDAVLRPLAGREAEVRRVAERFRGELYCFWQSNLGQGCFELPPRLAERWAAFGLSLRVDIMSWGEIEDGDHTRPMRDIWDHLAEG
jgi:hypothetical protein